MDWLGISEAASLIISFIRHRISHLALALTLVREKSLSIFHLCFMIFQDCMGDRYIAGIDILKIYIRDVFLLACLLKALIFQKYVASIFQGLDPIPIKQCSVEHA